MARSGTNVEDGEWSRARRAAVVQDVLSTFSRRPAMLMSFEHVQDRLQLGAVRYLGRQTVRLDDIAGSVGRYDDFTPAFLPRQDSLRERWQAVERMMAAGRELPPVELFKVGRAYFVRDGNHRVSVARHYGRTTIAAVVTEYETDVPLAPGSDVDELLCRQAHAAFVDRTGADRVCPELRLRLTEPGGYDDLLSEIEETRVLLSDVDGRDIGPDEGLRLWADLRYVPVVEVLRGRQMLEEFPGRTETDLYVWLLQNRAELARQYGQPLPVDAEADDLARRRGQGPSLPGRLRRAARRIRTRAAIRHR